MTDMLDEAIGAVRFANGQTGNVHFVATIMKAVARGELIRATTDALAASPEVKALIAAERERCAGECDRTAREADMFGDKHGRQISERTAAAIRGEKP